MSNETQLKKFLQACEEYIKVKDLIPSEVESQIESIEDLEHGYRKFAVAMKESSFDLGKWLPSFRRSVRNMVPGEFVMILADTGVGKTACLQNIALSCSPLPTLMFEIELPGTLNYERFIAMAHGVPSRKVEETYAEGIQTEWSRAKVFENLRVVSQSRLTIELIEKMIRAFPKKCNGQNPVVVLIDYVGLIGAPGTSRYERMSYVAEQIKILAKSTNTIIICAGQIHRKLGDEGSEVKLHDGKDSGSIENSAGLVLGVWKPTTGKPSDMKIKVLKNTKGRAGFIIDCNFNGETMQITETHQNYSSNLDQ